MKTYLRLLEFVRPYRGLFVLAVGFMILLGITTGLFAYLVGPLTKYMFSGGKGGGDYIDWLTPFDLSRNPGAVALWLPLVIVCVGVLKGFSTFGQSYFMGVVGQRVIVDVQNRMFRHLLHQPLRTFEQTGTGTIVTRFTYDVAQIQLAVTNGLSSILRDTLQVLILLGLAVYLDWRLALIFFVVYPAVIIPIVRFGRRLRHEARQAQEDVGRVSHAIHEASTNIRIVKAFTQQDHQISNFESETNSYFETMKRAIRVQATSSPVMELMAIIGLAASMFYATQRVKSGTLQPETFFSFFATVLMLYQPVKALGRLNTIVHNGLAAADRIFGFLDRDDGIKDAPDAAVIERFDGDICYENVSFRYHDHDVIRDVSFTMRRGSVTALVGASGAGKSTIVRLLPRFSDVTEGRISIDGRDIRECNLRSLRELIGIVTQEPLLFNDTILANVRFGRPNASMDAVRDALVAAHAWDFVEALPLGLETVVGERGVQLSGGERQRICIARAALKDAPILILDEATSSLDPQSEAHVRDALENLMRGRTTLIIAHRLSTIQHADQVIVLEGGRVVESGGRDLFDDGERLRAIFAV